ncbi:MAG TPA: sulfur carrier protein ThiS [Pyrinomonadaceae bacterium]
MRVTINGEERELPDGITLAALIGYLALAPDRLAIERNREVVRRSDWPQTTLNEDDRVEIIHFVGGGAQFKR